MFFRKSKKAHTHSCKPPDADLKGIHRHLGPAAHHGIPGMSLKLAFDPVQGVLAIGTLDGKVKLIGTNGVEGILVCASQSRCKHLEFANNQGFLVQVTAENDIQIWDLERRELTQQYKCETNVTAFAVIQGSPFMYLGEDSGDISILEYDKKQEKLCQMPYRIQIQVTRGDLAHSFNYSVIGILPYPDTFHCRVLIVYSDGVMAVWNVLDSKVQGTIRVSGKEPDNSFHSSDDELAEKDVCCICWADLSGNMLAVGYTDGDIWLWDSSIKSSGESCGLPVLKLQLSLDCSRLPILALCWCANRKQETTASVSGYLFVYGGQGVGCSEALTVYSLKSARGQLCMSNVHHMEIPLLGIFEDMILLPRPGAAFLEEAAVLLVLTGEGHLIAYDQVSISKALKHNKDSSTLFLPEPLIINPFTTDSSITVTMLAEFLEDAEAATVLCQLHQQFRGNLPSVLPGGTKWPVTGGILKKHPEEGSKLSAILFTGHADGSVNVWDASTSAFLQICQLHTATFPMLQQNANRVAVSNIEFCSQQGILLVARGSVVVNVYKLSRESREVRCIVCHALGTEDQLLYQSAGFHCVATLNIGVEVTSISISSFNGHVAIGYMDGTLSIMNVHCGKYIVQRKAVFPIHQKAVKFISFGPGMKVSGPSDQSLLNTSSSKRIVYVADNSTFTALVYSSADLLAFGPWRTDGSQILYIHCLEIFNKEKDEGRPDCTAQSSEKILDKGNGPPETSFCSHYLLVCSQSSAFLYHGLISSQARDLTTLKVAQFPTPCLSVSTFFCTRANARRIVLLKNAATLEIRSFSDLKIVQQFSMSAFYSLEPNVSKTPTLICGGLGLLALVNAEREIIIFPAFLEDERFRIAYCTVSFFDKEVAAAHEAALKAGSLASKRKNQGVITGVLKEIKEGLLKSPRNGKESNIELQDLDCLSKIFRSPLSLHNLGSPQPEQSCETEIEDSVVKLDLGKEKVSDPAEDRKKLIDDDQDDRKSVIRSPDEIRSIYGRKTGDMSSVAGQARDKLLERQEKLQALGKRTEELQGDAQNFAALAADLVKTMEGKKSRGRKWWKI